jgi:hypothetical protein
MAGERTFVVKFISDIAGATKGIKKVGDDLGGMGSKLASVLPSFKTMAIAGTAAFGAVAAASFKLVKMASSLEESQSKVNTVFGDSAGVINEFAKTSATSFGISKQAALEATGSFGALISAFGLGQSQASNMSVTLLKLAADLASFNNTDIESAIGALRSGLSGETEPLKKYGVVLSDVLLKEKALEMGLYDGKGALDVKSKVQASYALILEQTAIQQGDVSRTSEGFANQMKFLKASLSDAATELGTILLPYFKQFVIFVNQNIIPGVLLFARTIGNEGLVPALAVAAAAMGDFGISAINTLENMYLGMLQFTAGVAKTVRILADGIALGAAVSKNPLLAAQALAAAIAASNIQEAAEDAMEGAGAMFDRFRIKVGNAALALNAFKNINPVVEKVGEFEKVIKKVVPAMTEAEKAAAALAAGLGDGSGSKGGVTKTVKTAIEKLKDYTDALKSTNSAQKAFDRSQKASVKAGISLTEANTNLTDAQDKFNKAVAGFGEDSPEARKAATALGAAQRDLERANFGVEQSLFDVANAEENLAKVRKATGSDPDTIREAEISLAKAKMRVEEATFSVIEAEVELKKLRDSKDTNAVDLRKAELKLADSKFGVEQSLFAVKDAQDKLNESVSKKGSTPQEIREAEIELAEAKLAVADAIDRQDESTKTLTTSQDLLNDAIFGASIGSEIYKDLSEKLKDAKRQQADATDAVTDAIDSEAEALERYNIAFDKTGQLAKKYPKIAAANPMGAYAGSIPQTVTGNSGFTGRPEQGGGGVVVNVNAGMISDEATLVSDLNDMFTEFARRNGNQFAGFVGVR